MTTSDLMLKIKNALEQEGFITHPSQCVGGYEHDADARREEKSWIEQVDSVYKIRFWGYIINFRVVHAHNGGENKSVDAEVLMCRNGCRLGCTVETVRFHVDLSERQFQNRLKKLIGYYDSMEIWEKSDKTLK